MGLQDILTNAAAAAAAGPSAAADLIGGYYQGAVPTDGGPAAAPSSAAGGGLQVVDYRDLAVVSQPAGASGIILVTYPPVDPGQVWLCDRYTVECNSTSPTDCFVYLGDPALQNFRDGTASGNLDVADNNSALQIPGSRSITFQWIGASVGAVAIASIQYRVLGAS